MPNARRQEIDMVKVAASFAELVFFLQNVTATPLGTHIMVRKVCVLLCFMT
jgi:hypothetical protein